MKIENSKERENLDELLEHFESLVQGNIDVDEELNGVSAAIIQESILSLELRKQLLTSTRLLRMLGDVVMRLNKEAKELKKDKPRPILGGMMRNKDVRINA